MKWFFLIVTAFSVCFSATVFSEEHDHSSQTVEYFVHSHPISKGEKTVVYPTFEAEGDNLFAEVHGEKHLIYDPKFEFFYLKHIKQILDLDEDGRLEVIIGLHNGGNGSGYNYAIVSHRGDANFTVHMHENLYSWADLQILEDKSFVINQKSIGAGNTSMDENQYVFRFERGKLELVSGSSNTAYLNAEVEILASELRHMPNQETMIEVNIDQDEGRRPMLQ